AAPAVLAGGGVATGVDPVAPHPYLTSHAVVPARRTLLSGVTKPPPATMLVVEPDGRRRRREYWNPWVDGPPAAAPDAGADPVEWRQAVEQALRTAVRRRLVADVPVGVLLSG